VNDGQMVYKIGVVGPRSVGKTTLITSILTDCQRLLAGLPVTMRPCEDGTEELIARNRKALDGSLLAGEFTPGALEGTVAPAWFKLLLDPQVPGVGIRFDILDFPGGWLDPEHPERRRAGESAWRGCERFITESTVLLVPIDAAVLMEADRQAYTRAVPSILTTYLVEDVARLWAMRRNERASEPALMVLCPLKCESYFADNGGRRDRSEELSRRVVQAYQRVVQAVRQEAPGAKIAYCPIDTIGCVDLKGADWTPAGGDSGDYLFQAHYRVRRRPATMSPRGVDDLFGLLCRHLVDATRQVEHDGASAAAGQADLARRYAVRDEGFLGNVWVWLTGERQRRHEEYERFRERAGDAARRVAALEQVVSRLADRPLSDRSSRL